MALLIKITDPDGANPTILSEAENKTYYETVNSSDEGVTFDIAKNLLKTDVINPYSESTAGYAKFWEVWDTVTNERLNYGPITNITEDGPNWKITGAGRSQLLQDIISSNKTFYARIDKFVDDLRFENLAIEPRTTTIVHDLAQDGPTDVVFGTTIPDEAFHGLSSRTKDNAIDDATGYIKLNQTEPSRSFYTTTSMWAGTSPEDALMIDLGKAYDINRIKLLFPWWGGKERRTNRTYEFDIYYATTSGFSQMNPAYEAYNRTIGSFMMLYTTQDNFNYRDPYGYLQDINRIVTYPEYPYDFWIGPTQSGIGYGPNNFYVGLNPDQSGLSTDESIKAQYIRVNIRGVNALYGSNRDDDPSHNSWDYQCNPDYIQGSDPFFGNKKGIMAGKTMPDRAIKPESDCFASIVEIGILKKLLPRGDIKPLALQKIDNQNLQITYSHTPDSSETKGTKNGRRKYEPGSFFRNIKFDYSGANNTHYKFFPTDCANCYPDGYHFAIMDHNNNTFYMTDQTAGSNISHPIGIYTRYVQSNGSPDFTVTWVDCWNGKTDPLSYSGSYAFSETTGDTATLHFRGRSLKWFATVPDGKTGATVKIEYREKSPSWFDSSGGVLAEAWGSWTTLENSFKIPDAIHAEKVWEQTYETGVFQNDHTYEVRITNLDGNYCSIDSFEGYWSASFTMYNEDNTKIRISNEAPFKQIYDARFSEGSMYKWNQSAGLSFTFEGDRVILLSAKGRNHGKFRLYLWRYNKYYGEYDPGLTNHVFIPGGASDGSLTIDLNNGKRGNESTQHVIFDSNSSFPGGLTWGLYTVSLSNFPIETYSTTKNEQNSDNFVYRCSACKADASGSSTINKYVYFDAIGVHEAVGISVSFENKTNLDQLKSVAEALQVEWNIDEGGVSLVPRVGTDTDYALREGSNTLVNYQIVNDVTQMASMLFSYGSDIDGLPLFTITEDKKAEELLGRTVMRQEDFRDLGDYQQLIGISRGSLRKRRTPQMRITVTHLGEIPINKGDSFLLYTKKMGQIRVRATRKERSESGSGTTYNLECTIWPLTS